jgi:hypothetical protein
MRDLEDTRSDHELRDRAIRRLKKKHDFHAHLLVYGMVNAFLVVIWALTGAHFFWPIFPMVGWGIGVVMNAWDVYRSEEPNEDQIRREMDAMSRQAHPARSS